MADRIIHGAGRMRTATETSQEAAARAQSLVIPAQEKRNAASMSRKAFCLKLLEMDILPADEASLAARGGWPATFATFTSGLTARRKAEVEIEWSTSMTIRYVAPPLQALSLIVAGGDQAQATALLDTIFGVS